MSSVIDLSQPDIQLRAIQALHALRVGRNWSELARILGYKSGGSIQYMLKAHKENTWTDRAALRVLIRITRYEKSKDQSEQREELLPNPPEISPQYQPVVQASMVAAHAIALID